MTTFIQTEDCYLDCSKFIKYEITEDSFYCRCTEKTIIKHVVKADTQDDFYNIKTFSTKEEAESWIKDLMAKLGITLVLNG